MVLNPYFQQGAASEQNLVQSLINEQLKIYGIEIYYLPRQYVTKNTVIKEVIESKFTDAYPLEAYVDTYEGYEGVGTLLSKFGIQELDDLNLVISQERFSSYISPLIKNIPNIELSTRPKEGDLIYFPLGDRLFEIKYVEHEKPFYQLQKNYVYELRCELFRYEDEVVDVGVEAVDDVVIDKGYLQTLTLVGVGTTAAAITTVRNKTVRFITIENRGNDYTSAPRVAISSAPAGGVDAVGIATLYSDSIDCDGVKSPKVQGVELRNPGVGYTVAPGIGFIHKTGVGAAATVGIASTGAVGVVTVSDGGGGYYTAPTVTFEAPTHVGAAATATLDSPIGTGVSVTSATIDVGPAEYLFPGGTTGGVFYSRAPKITFSLPTGSANNATATATLDTYSVAGGTIKSIGVGSGGRFYDPDDPPTVTIAAPGASGAAATVGLSGSAINPSTVAFSTAGRAYTTAPTVAISTGTAGFGIDAVITAAIGIVTIHSVTGAVTAIGFNTQTDAWAAGTAATVGLGYTVPPLLTFSGSTAQVRATATATVSVAGTVTAIAIGNSGFGYGDSAPTVTIAAPDASVEEFRALGTCHTRLTSVQVSGTLGIGSDMISGITTNNIIIGDRVRLSIGHSDTYGTDQGSNNFIQTDTYVSSIGVSSIFMSKVGVNAGIATTTFEFGIANCGVVTGIGVTYGGGGYLTPPTISIGNSVADKNYTLYDWGGVGIHTAKGTAVISSAGIVTAVRITDAGHGYVIGTSANPPSITFSDPETDNSGDYIVNETVTGSISSTTAIVNSWNSSTNVLTVKIVDGTWTGGEKLTGSESGASRTLRIINTDDLVTPYADNDNIETAADDILDFSETNPFGTP
jgi:hypothetical protein